MQEVIQTILISTLPAAVTSMVSYFAAVWKGKTQIEAIKEQNRAEIEKLIQQGKMDIEAIKEKHRLELELKENEHKHEMEKMELQLQNELKKEEDIAKNQVATNLCSGLFSSMFKPGTPISDKLNEEMAKVLQQAVSQNNEEK